MNDNLHISENGKKLIRRFEGFAKWREDLKVGSYKCSAGKWTIGFGNTYLKDGTPVDQDTVLTVKECEELFDSSLIKYEDAVKKLVKVELKQHQFDALVSFCFNAGAGNLEKSTLLKRVNANDENAHEEFRRWIFAGGKPLRGLILRRDAEEVMFKGSW